MGNPPHFSLEIPRRCQMLIDNVWPTISLRKEDGSLPLNASFLLAVSTPMVNLPIERIWKPQMNRAVGHLNDSVLNSRLAKAIRSGIGSAPVLKAPFFCPDEWRYVYLPKGLGLPDLSKQGLPQFVESSLASGSAVSSASAISTELFCSILRNGLAHGGILFLDKDGRSTHDAPVRMFCFVSTKSHRKRGVEGLHFLRIRMKEYRKFLKLWTNWLQTYA